MGKARINLLVGSLFLAMLVMVGCRESAETPTPDFISSSPTVTAVPPTETPTPVPPTPTGEPGTIPETTGPPLATATLPPTQTPIPQVTIEVLSSEDGQPIPGAVVRLSQPEQGYAAVYSTLEDGTAHFVGFIPTSDAYTLDVSAIGFRPISIEITLTSGINELAIQLENGVIARITTEIANLRAGPGLTFDILLEVPEGQVFAVIDVSEDGEWIQIRTPEGIEGWVFASLVETEGDLSQFDEETAVPTPETEETPTPESESTLVPTATVEGQT